MFKITNYKIYKHAWIDKRAPHFGEKLDSTSISELLSNGGIMVRNTCFLIIQNRMNQYFIEGVSLTGVMTHPRFFLFLILISSAKVVDCRIYNA